MQIRPLLLAALFTALIGTPPVGAQTPHHYDVRTFGAAGDGKTPDTAAINKAIDAASEAGGGTVYFPAGSYLSYSVHLKSNIALYLEQGATLVAADPPAADAPGGYDPPEPNDAEKYQDFGHTHWHNSLIWGENLVNVSILGPGTIFGKGLSRGQGRQAQPPGEEPAPGGGRGARAGQPGGAAGPGAGPVGAPGAGGPRGARGDGAGGGEVTPETPFGYPNARDTLPAGVGNKAISLKNCRNVILRDFTIFHGGHFGILATGVDNFTLDNLKIDTNRDGMDIDCCRNVRVSNCTINSPGDDGLCLKSSFGLGYNRATENVTITNCQVSGYVEGTLLDGTRKHSPSGRSPTGRIKFGTEANGGFKNISISNCVFEYCRGLAIEEVDGGAIEDVTISNITMRDIDNAPIFIRLGARLRGPGEVPASIVRRVSITGIVAHNVSPAHGILIAGLPGNVIEDVSLSNILIDYRGGGTAEQAAREEPEFEKAYPEPSSFGTIPSYGMFARHVKNLTLDHVELRYAAEDLRPACILDDVTGADFTHLKAQHAAGVPTLVLKNVNGFILRSSPGLPDTTRDQPVAADKL